MISIYPIPAPGKINIAINNEIQSNISFELLDITGKKITTLFDGLPATGNNVLSFSLEKYGAGFYFIKSVFDGRVQINKILIR